MSARYNFRPLSVATVIAAVFAATTLAACDRGQQPERTQAEGRFTMSRAQQKIDSAKNDMTQGAADAKRDMKEMGNDAKNAVSDATNYRVVNAKLASDKDLSALRINVDTVDGRVALRGSAPTRRRGIAHPARFGG